MQLLLSIDAEQSGLHNMDMRVDFFAPSMNGIEVLILLVAIQQGFQNAFVR